MEWIGQDGVLTCYPFPHFENRETCGTRPILGSIVGKDNPYESQEPSTRRDIDSGLDGMGTERTAPTTSPRRRARPS